MGGGREFASAEAGGCVGIRYFWVQILVVSGCGFWCVLVHSQVWLEEV